MTVRELLAQENPDALLYDERFDSALVGWTLGFGVKNDTRPVAVYDYQSLVGILAADFERDAELAAEDLEEHDFRTGSRRVGQRQHGRGPPGA